MPSLLSLIVLIFLSACATSPERSFAELQAIEPKLRLQDQLVSSREKELPVLSPGKAVRGEITTRDPVAVWQNHQGELMSSYVKPLQISAESASTIEIELDSLCDCLGFRKFLMLPTLAVSHPDNRFEFLSDMNPQQRSFEAPVRSSGLYRFTTNLAGKYTLWILSTSPRRGPLAISVRKPQWEWLGGSRIFYIPVFSELIVYVSRGADYLLGDGKAIQQYPVGTFRIQYSVVGNP